MVAVFALYCHLMIILYSIIKIIYLHIVSSHLTELTKVKMVFGL